MNLAIRAPALPMDTGTAPAATSRFCTATVPDNGGIPGHRQQQNRRLPFQRKQLFYMDYSNRPELHHSDVFSTPATT